jgi:hypothetical protein
MNSKNKEHKVVAENEAAILRQAMEALKALVPLEYEMEPVCDLLEQVHDHLVQVKIFGQEMHWCIQVIRRLTKTAELQMLIYKDKAQQPFLLVTGYVPIEAAIRLYNGGIQFIDTVGNAFINQPPLFIFVKGTSRKKKMVPFLPAVSSKVSV